MEEALNLKKPGKSKAHPVRVLPRQLIGRIAAGEVVHHPASVVRELVENALDSGASEIAVTLELTDSLSVIVEDNGCGIDKSDIEHVVKRHATSKISDYSEVFTNDFCGFRGEALTAISAVSKFSIITSNRDDGLGLEATYDGEKLISQKKVDRQRGTTVKALDLFFNVPVREKFLGDIKREKSLIKKEVIMYALAHPETTFRYFIVDGDQRRLDLSVPAVLGLRERIIRFFPQHDLAKSLVPFEEQREGFSLSGYVTDHRTHVAHRRYQYLFYRGRGIENPLFYRATREAYRYFLPSRRFPMIFLTLAVDDPFLVDVNVHPSKREVRFKKGFPFYVEVYRALRDQLQKRMHFISQISDGERPSLEEGDFAQGAGDGKRRSGEGTSHKPFLEEEREAPEFSKAEGADGARESIFHAPGFSNQERGAQSFDEQPIRIFGQVALLYIVFSIGDDLFLMDQHAAHERVNYDYLLKEKFSQVPERQTMVVPMVFQKTEAECDVLLSDDSLSTLKRLGVVLGRIGQTQVSVEEVPAFLNDRQREKIIAEILEAVVENNGVLSDDFFQELIARLACRMSIMAGEKLTHEQMNELVIEIIKKNYQIACPHGRPFVKKISLSELDGFFDRSRHISKQ